jgi:glycosyltransferase involved in cell wall biosynthesis
VSDALHIGIDARELLGEVTGVGRYLGELITRWVQRADSRSRRLILYAPRPLDIALPKDAVATRVIPGGTGTWWEQTRLRRALRADRLDVFFAPAYTAPLGLRIPFGVTMHDVSFLAHPEWFRPRERLRRRFLAHRLAKSASVIFTDSDFSRAEIASHLHVDDGRVQVIRPGISRTGARSAHAGRSDKRDPLVLYVGTLLNRRNLPELIAAFAKATPDMPRARLVIVGANRTWPPQDLKRTAAAFDVSSKVEIRSYLPHEHLQEHYSRASVFAFLSEYEGFGLTPLEALSAGVPIVVLDTPVAREVYGPAAEYVGAGDIEGTASAIRRFLDSRSAANQQLSRAPEVLATYSWDRAADDTLHHLERICR